MSWPKGKPRPAGAGRRKGTPNKVSKDLRGMIEGALEAAGGQDYFERMAKEQPQAFMGLAGRLLPKDLNVKQTGSLTLSIGLSNGRSS